MLTWENNPIQGTNAIVEKLTVSLLTGDHVGGVSAICMVIFRRLTRVSSFAGGQGKGLKASLLYKGSPARGMADRAELGVVWSNSRPRGGRGRQKILLGIVTDRHCIARASEQAKGDPSSGGQRWFPGSVGQTARCGSGTSNQTATTWPVRAQSRPTIQAVDPKSQPLLPLTPDHDLSHPIPTVIPPAPPPVPRITI